MHWDMTYSSWDEFPIPQKWFATGEAIAHLRYLEEQGAIRRVAEIERIFYTAVPEGEKGGRVRG